MNTAADYQNELFQLFSAALNDQISEQEHQRLQQILKEDGAARQLWFEFNDVECGLGELRPFSAQLSEFANLSSNAECHSGVGRVQGVECAENFTEADTRRSHRDSDQGAGLKWGPLAAAAVVALGFGVHQSMEAGRKDTPRQTEIARFGVMHDPLWASPDDHFKQGDTISEGQTLEIFSGSVDVRFGSGAEVTLQAPCIFQVTSRNSGYLTLGQINGRANAIRGKGFSVQTPTASVVDVSTEFVASVEADGKSWVEAISGEVQVQLAGVTEPQLLVEGNTLAVESGRPQVMIRVENGDGTPDFRFPSIEPPSDAGLVDSGKMQSAVRVLDGHKPGAGVPLPELAGSSAAFGEPPAYPSVVRKNTETGQILVDLGHEVSVNKINTYSWAAGVAPESGGRSVAQKYALYGYPDGEVPRLDGVLDDHGWDLIGRVDPESLVGANVASEQQVSSISASSGAIGRYRYLLWSVQPVAGALKLADWSALYSEFDVYAAQ
ncbi:MAG: hypothetical protein WCO60_09410 [Verrucomicrobiota bacterium]